MAGRLTHELQNHWQAGLREAGCDEAGRGCLAGPVVAAAVVLHPDRPIPGLNDSKQLTEAERNHLAAQVKLHADCWAVASCSPAEIDQLNILWASVMAMHRALDQLPQPPELVLVDGNRFRPWGFVPYQCVVKGDTKLASIAAASILAKTHRDKAMAQLAEEFPHYHWQRNKGYPTPDHKEALLRLGPSPWHRKTFRGVVPG